MSEFGEDGLTPQVREYLKEKDLYRQVVPGPLTIEEIEKEDLIGILMEVYLRLNKKVPLDDVKVALVRNPNMSYKIKDQLRDWIFRLTPDTTEDQARAIFNVMNNINK